VRGVYVGIPSLEAAVDAGFCDVHCGRYGSKEKPIKDLSDILNMEVRHTGRVL